MSDRSRLEMSWGSVAMLSAGALDDPAVLLVPGYTGSKEDFQPILEPIADAGYRVSAIDLPGQFESTGLPAAHDYTPDRLATCLLEVIDSIGSPLRLLGHSFGGLVARAAVIARPEAVASLVLLCSGPAALGGVRRVRIEQLEPVLASSGLPGVFAAMQAAEAAEPGFVAPSDDVADFLRRRFLGGSPSMLQGMGDALRREPDRVAELAATGVAVLVAHGADDDAWDPADQRQMATSLGAEYAVISNAAHSPAVENPAGTVDVLRAFWSR